MRRMLYSAGVLVLASLVQSLGGCIAERQGRYAALAAPETAPPRPGATLAASDARGLCRGIPDPAERTRCRGAFARDAAAAEAAEAGRLRYATERVATGLARGDGETVRCAEGTVDGRLVTACSGAPRTAR